MKNVTAVKKFIAVLLVLMVAFAAFGCRPSHRLEKIRYVDNADIADDLQELDYDEENLEEWLDDHVVDEDDDQLTDQQDAGQMDEDSADDNGTNTGYDPDGEAGKSQEKANTSEANDGSLDMEEIGDVSDEPASEQQVVDDIEYTGDEGSGDIFEDLNGGSSEQESDNSGDGGGDEDPFGDPTNPDARPSDATGLKTVILEGGEIIDVPTGAKKVTATGFAAQVVEMVGGSGRLAGTNADLYENEVFKMAVTDRDQIGSWWNGDGSSNILDFGFEALIADKDITVVFEISGQQSFSQDQVNTLLDDNVQIVTIYPPDSISHIRDDVTIIGTVLNGGLDTTAERRAANYNSWLTNTLNSVSSAAGSVIYYTLFVAGWDYNATYRITNWGFEPDLASVTGSDSGTGLAYAYTPWAAPANLYKEVAGYAGVRDTAVYTPSSFGWTLGSTADDLVYVEPAFGGLEADVDGAASRYMKIAGFTRFLVPNEDNTSINLGTNYFPAVITSSTNVLEEIRNNPFWTWRGYSGPLLPVNSYKLYVNPSGMGNWLEGSVESPLEAVWLKWAINDSGNSDKNSVTDTIVSFYSDFFNGSDEAGIREYYSAQLDRYATVSR